MLFKVVHFIANTANHSTNIVMHLHPAVLQNRGRKACKGLSIKFEYFTRDWLMHT